MTFIGSKEGGIRTSSNTASIIEIFKSSTNIASSTNRSTGGTVSTGGVASSANRSAEIIIEVASGTVIITLVIVAVEVLKRAGSVAGHTGSCRSRTSQTVTIASQSNSEA